MEPGASGRAGQGGTSEFTGRRVLVTGASRGIGAATARRLAAGGADVAIVARTLDHHPKVEGSLNETAAAIRSEGARVAVVVADLALESDRERIVPDAVAGLGGPIDVLINNAAYGSFHTIAEYPLDEARRTYEINMVAPMHLAQAVLPAMTERGEGWIVNLSSGSARMFGPPPFRPLVMGSTLAVYAATKAALNQLTAALAMETYGTGVRVNTVEPRAAVMTQAARAELEGKLRDDQIETMEQMVEAVAALCRCPVDHTGYTDVSLDLIDSMGLKVAGSG
ncbi:MAG TPA: SDR family oxidoreductase [Acidimicrobiales bacterium]|nr:SDR family oxidoreductase [Acidimicrobiales bacterium]